MYVAAWMLAIMKVKWRTALFHTLVAVADPESFHWVGIQYRNSALQYATVLTTVLRYLGRRESGVVLGLPETWLGPPLTPNKYIMKRYVTIYLVMLIWPHKY
jgi:hypothetical protein